MYSNDIYHHGILGQKWGKRNGPPYPLGASKSRAIKKSASYTVKRAKVERDKNKKSSDNNSDENQNGFQLTDKQKKYIKIGAAVVGTALVAYGGYRLYKYANGKITLKNPAIGGTNFEFRTRIINPGYNSKDYPTMLGSRMNCGNCAMATELQARGQAFRAKLNTVGMYPEKFNECFTGMHEGTYNSIKFSAKDLPSILDENRGSKIQSMLEKQLFNKYPENSRGVMYLPGSMGSHFMPWIKENGKLRLLNPQNDAASMIERHLAGYMPGTVGDNLYGIWSMRLDDLQITDKIYEMVDSVDSTTQTFSSEQWDALLIKGSNFVMKKI